MAAAAAAASGVERHTISRWIPKQWKYAGKSPKIAAIAQSNSGKSVAIAAMLAEWTDIIDAVVIFSQTEAATGFWGNRIAPGFIHHKLDIPVLQRLIATQKALGKRAPRVMVLLDDVLSDTKSMNHPVVLQLVTEGRNYNLGCIFPAQDLYMIPASFPPF
jgi:hypothetical protein